MCFQWFCLREFSSVSEEIVFMVVLICMRNSIFFSNFSSIFNLRFRPGWTSCFGHWSLKVFSPLNLFVCTLHRLYVAGVETQTGGEAVRLLWIMIVFHRKSKNNPFQAVKTYPLLSKTLPRDSGRAVGRKGCSSFVLPVQRVRSYAVGLCCYVTCGSTPQPCSLVGCSP